MFPVGIDPGVGLEEVEVNRIRNDVHRVWGDACIHQRAAGPLAALDQLVAGGESATSDEDGVPGHGNQYQVEDPPADTHDLGPQAPSGL